jgi:hypothetical protein
MGCSYGVAGVATVGGSLMDVGDLLEWWWWLEVMWCRGDEMVAFGSDAANVWLMPVCVVF